MRSRLHALVVLVVVGLAPACTRGCNTGGCNLGGCASRATTGDPVPSCNSDRDCAAPEVCRRAYCRTPVFAAKEDFCRAHPSCKEAGHCGAERVRSFLGASDTLECVAVDVADCKVSTNCAVHGRCSLETALQRDRCIADQVPDCLASTNCTSLEECVPLGGNCVRQFTGCTPAADDAFATDDAFVRDLAAIGDATPGAVDDGLLACVAKAGGVQSFVRVGSSCTSGPHHAGHAFARRVSLVPGDAIAVAVQDHDASGQHDPLLKLTYTGSSPIANDGDEPAIVCHVIPRATAAAIGERVLGEVDRAIAVAKAQRLARDTYAYFPDRIADLRAQVAHAAGWLGAQHADIAARTHQLDDLEAARQARIAANIAATASHAAPVGTAVAAGDHLRVTVRGLVCGDALRARYAAAGDPRTVAATACAAELAVENRGTADVDIGWLGIGAIRPLWLRPRSGLAMASASATVIDAQRGTEPAARTLRLAAGEHAIVLVGDERADLELGAGHTDAGALLRLATWDAPDATLRTDAAP